MPEIWFVNLNIKIERLSRTAFSIFGFDVYWYSVFIFAGFAAGLLLALKEAKRIGHDKNIYYDFVYVMFFVGLLGARVYYVIFSWDRYKNDLLGIFNIRNGGLAIYGGILAVFAAGIVFARLKKISFGAFADVCVPCVAVGQAIGRFGNFFNREVFGGYTDSLFAMRYLASQVDIIPESVAEHMVYVGGTAYIQVQPTFLYESIWNICLFAVLSFFARHKQFDGQILFMYFAGYGIGRFWLEGIRTDRLYLPGTVLPVSQIVALVTTVVSVALIVFFLVKKKRESSINK